MDRVSTRKEKRKVHIYLGIIVFLVIFFAIFGIQLFTKISLLLAPSSKGATSQTGNKLALIAPRLDPMGEATNSAEITISGYANSGESVEISTETDIIKVLAAKDGTFSAPNIELVEGENRISAVSKKDKKESPPSQVLVITYKNTPPKLEVSEPEDGKEYVGDQREATIKGVTDQDARVTINDRFVRVEDDGSFSIPYSLSEGEVTLSIKSTDVAGNETVVLRKVKYRP